MEKDNKIQSKKNETQGSIWRPIDTIRAKVIGLAKQEDRLLVCEVLNDQGELKGWCPLGGGIEFGETGEQALKREIAEELGCGIHISGEMLVCENIFEHHGFIGHEIILAFPINFDDPEIYAKKRFQIYESNGSVHWVEWIELNHFRSGKSILFPPALTKQIL
ncbi:MAG: NUDIX domain-containing protein [Parachlamydiaceae bacterium]|nr:NUDIX domain-containing protein [Parachlamydiaceae bacterium]